MKVLLYNLFYLLYNLCLLETMSVNLKDVYFVMYLMRAYNWSYNLSITIRIGIRLYSLWYMDFLIVKYEIIYSWIYVDGSSDSFLVQSSFN